MDGIKHKEKKSTELWKKLERGSTLQQKVSYPKVTVAIPTYNSDQFIAQTLDSVLKQDYPDLEIIVIDAGSTDRTLTIIRNFYSDLVRIYSVTGYNLYEMFNKGIALAEGQYINFLYPGDFYIQHDATKDVMALALRQETPQLVFGASLLRDDKNDVRVLFRALDLKHLQIGQLPTALQSCWFRLDVFRTIGEFDDTVGLRGNLELLCRFVKDQRLTVVSTSRVYTDHELRSISRRMILGHFWQTLSVIYRHFGVFSVLRWFFYQKDIRRFFRSWWRSAKFALFGRVSG